MNNKMRVCLDIGGTNTRVAAMQDGKIVKIEKFETIQNFDEQIKKLTATISSLEVDFDAISISAPGPANYETGEFGWLPNLTNWRGENIITSLSQNFKGKKIIANNDANLMALAHHHYFKNEDGITQFFTVSTGLGMGLIINNRMFKGFNGAAQEVANAPLAFSEESGKSLGKGSLEYFSSGSGLAMRTGFDTKEAFERYDTDTKVKAIIDEGVETLANAIAVSAAFVNPNLMVFDGSVARWNKWYVEKAFEKAKDRMMKEQADVLNIEFSEIGDDAAIIGAYHAIDGIS